MSAAALTAGTTSATNTRATGETFYRPELDALRFFAFLAVMVHHYLPQTSTFYESRLHASAASANWMVAVAGVGGLGVELFFVLSAFLITSLLLRERAARGEVHIAAFYLRRALRIWPLYFFFLALVFLFAHLTHDVGFNFRLHDAGAFAIFIGNWLGNLDAVPLSVVPLWSVCVEEQFYLCWPWVMRRASSRTLIAVCCAVVVVGMVSRGYAATRPDLARRIWNLSFTHLDAIAAGGLLAHYLRARTHRPSTSTRVLLVVAGMVGLVLWVRYSGMWSPSAPHDRVIFGYTVVALCCAGIFLSTYGSRGPFGLLHTKTLTYLGRISYGLYVWHEFGFYLARKLVPGWHLSGVEFATYFFAAFGVTLCLAVPSYHFLELPFLSLKKRFTYVRSGPLQA